MCNFRSIKDQTLHFTHNCMILVGDNEAGKSNVLKAIVGGLSQNTYPFSAKDRRKVLVGETPPSEKDYYVQYIYRFQGDEMSEVLAKIPQVPLGSIIRKNRKILSLIQYCQEYLAQFSYIFDTQTLQGKISLLEEESLDVPFALTRPLYMFLDSVKCKGIQYEKGAITDDDDVPSAHILLKEIGSVELFQILTHEISLYFQANKPEVVFWNYSDKFILPDEISIKTFRTSPEVSIPLRNIFDLAMVSHIDQAFTEAEKTDGDYANLLERVSVIATKKFAKIWPHLHRTKILISSDGDLLRVKMQEIAKYDFSERSEGCKRFLSILLMLSIQVETGKYANRLLVIDEPDNSLYPKGSQYLRDELLKMADNNQLLYTTHSPFMVDRKTIDRHVIVSKTKDITYMQETRDSMFIHDEVLLHAIGTSMFQWLTPNNLLFEGRPDHSVFRAAMSGCNIKHIGLYEKFKDVGIAYVYGVSSFKHVTPIVQLARKNIFIFSGSAKPSKNAQASYKREKGYQCENWYTIEDLGGDGGLSVEDYLYDSFLQIGLDEVMGRGKKKVCDKGDSTVMKFLSDLSKEQKSLVKDYYANHVTLSDIKPSYYLLLYTLWEKIESFSSGTV